MTPEIRRIIVIEAHRRRSGSCPRLIHSLGTGESFRIEPAGDGFTDLTSGLVVHPGDASLSVPGCHEPIRLGPSTDVALFGYEPSSGQNFTVRASGGASVTLFTGAPGTYFQYAIDDQA